MTPAGHWFCATCDDVVTLPLPYGRWDRKQGVPCPVCHKTTADWIPAAAPTNPARSTALTPARAKILFAELKNKILWTVHGVSLGAGLSGWNSLNSSPAPRAIQININASNVARFSIFQPPTLSPRDCQPVTNFGRILRERFVRWTGELSSVHG